MRIALWLFVIFSVASLRHCKHKHHIRKGDINININTGNQDHKDNDDHEDHREHDDHRGHKNPEDHNNPDDDNNPDDHDDHNDDNDHGNHTDNGGHNDDNEHNDHNNDNEHNDHNDHHDNNHSNDHNDNNDDENNNESTCGTLTLAPVWTDFLRKIDINNDNVKWKPGSCVKLIDRDALGADIKGCRSGGYTITVCDNKKPRKLVGRPGAKSIAVKRQKPCKGVPIITGKFYCKRVPGDTGNDQDNLHDDYDISDSADRHHKGHGDSDSNEDPNNLSTCSTLTDAPVWTDFLRKIKINNENVKWQPGSCTNVIDEDVIAGEKAGCISAGYTVTVCDNEKPPKLVIRSRRITITRRQPCKGVPVITGRYYCKRPPVEDNGKGRKS